MRRFLTIVAVFLAFGNVMSAQKVIGETAAFDTLVHDFGTITENQGPQSCTFNVTNIGSEELVIYAVMSTCGCTEVYWTREVIAAGKSGVISATYSNDEGPYPFDKTLKVYLSNVQKPVVLHMKGNVVRKKK